jgi:hypothetical protein
VLAIALSALIVAMPVHRQPVRCRIPALSTSPGHVWPISSIEQFVDSADVVVRARAVEAGPTLEKRMLLSETGHTVRFKAIELIRQDTTLDEFVVYGDLENIDDYNSRPVPYQLVRSGGQHGNCRATQYRVGAEYLFLQGTTGVDDELVASAMSGVGAVTRHLSSPDAMHMFVNRIDQTAR